MDNMCTCGFAIIWMPGTAFFDKKKNGKEETVITCY